VKERQERLRAIRDIIKENKVDSQEAMLERLSREGWAVTQATLSRDLKTLKIGKIPNGAAGYLYTLPENRESDEHSYIQDFVGAYRSIDWSANLVVIHTFAGLTDATSIALDKLGLSCVLGTIAGGDDTVFVALREGKTGEDFMAELRSQVPELARVKT
jgi:transcriptional regulator of arginine metabolism